MLSSSVPPPPTERESARLMAIVAVAPENRVMCQQPGCGHGVYAAIHVVQVDGQLLVMGSSCFAKRFGSANALGTPKYAGAGIQQLELSDEERSMLVSNTAALLERFANQAEQQRAEAIAKLERMRALSPSLPFTPLRTIRTQPPGAPSPSGSAPSFRAPWPWQNKRNTSVALFRGPSGQHWVRVQHQDGSQKIVPWPVFEGWNIALPPPCGIPDMELLGYAVADIVVAIQTLKALGYEGPLVGRWQDVRPRL